VEGTIRWWPEEFSSAFGMMAIKKATETKHLRFWSWIINIVTHYVQNIAWHSVIINMSKVETLKIYPADITYVEPVASSYCVTITLNKKSITITLIYVWNNKLLQKRFMLCAYCSGIATS
jgi:hypothetical protein